MNTRSLDDHSRRFLNNARHVIVQGGGWKLPRNGGTTSRKNMRNERH
jgi:hypothetical protein